MAMKKLFRITMHAPPDVMHDIMLMGGKGVEIIDVQPIRHGGEDERGQLQSRPTGREVVLAYAQAHPGEFKAMHIYKEAERLGVSKGSISVAVAKMYREGEVKRVGGGAYTLKDAAPRKSDEAPRKSARGSAPETILQIVKQRQNGSGEGVPLNEIRQALKAHGGEKNMARAIKNLLARKELKQTAPRHYRVGE